MWVLPQTADDEPKVQEESDMTSTVADLHRVITCLDEDGGERISAFGMDRAEICGAFKPAGRPYWLIYISTTVAEAGGRSHPRLVPPHLQLGNRQNAREWGELIAGLYDGWATARARGVGGPGHRQTTAKAAPRGRSPARQSGEPARRSAAAGPSLL